MKKEMEQARPLNTGLQDGLLQYYNSVAKSADTNIEQQIEKEPFFLRLKNDGAVEHNIVDKK
jgi:hypothetical protein